MKLRIVIILIAAFFTFAAAANAQSAAAKIEDLAWMAGCWESNNDARKLRISEQWMKPAGAMMIGSGRTVRDGKTVDYEFVRIVEEADGIYYIAKPKANMDETRFKLIMLTANAVTFENPAHDFPQRVMYRLSGAKLTGRIEGTQNGKERGIDFPMARARCD